MVAVSRSGAGLIAAHKRKLACLQVLDHHARIGDPGRVGIIDGNAYFAEAHHRTCAHSADNNGVHLSLMEYLHGDQTAAGLVTGICHRFDIDYSVIAVKINHGEEVAMTEMF